MTQVFLFHIDLTLTVAMVTENGRKYRLNRENVILDHNFEGGFFVFFCFAFFLFSSDTKTHNI